MDISIRHLRPDDAPAVGTILSGTTVMLGTMRLPYAPEERIAERIAAREGAYKLAAEVEGEVVGLALMQTFPEIPRHNHVGEIDLIAVREDWHGQGVAKALMNALLDLADNWLQLDHTGLMVWSDNARAITLYEAFGFELEGTIRRYARRPGGNADANIMGRLNKGLIDRASNSAQKVDHVHDANT